MKELAFQYCYVILMNELAFQYCYVRLMVILIFILFTTILVVLIVSRVEDSHNLQLEFMSTDADDLQRYDGKR